MNNYEKVARWIYHECDEPITEIEWLLEEVEEFWINQDRNLSTEYDGVFEYFSNTRVCDEIFIKLPLI